MASEIFIPGDFDLVDQQRAEQQKPFATKLYGNLGTLQTFNLIAGQYMTLPVFNAQTKEGESAGFQICAFPFCDTLLTGLTNLLNAWLRVEFGSEGAFATVESIEIARGVSMIVPGSSCRGYITVGSAINETLIFGAFVASDPYPRLVLPSREATINVASGASVDIPLRIFTRRAIVGSPDCRVNHLFVEFVRGATVIHSVEIPPGARSEWIDIPSDALTLRITNMGPALVRAYFGFQFEL